MTPVDDTLDRLEQAVSEFGFQATNPMLATLAAEALATVRSALQQLREERDAALDREAGTSDALQEMKADRDEYDAILGRRMEERDAAQETAKLNYERALAAEAEVQRLTDLYERATKNIGRLMARDQRLTEFVDHTMTEYGERMSNQWRAHARALLADSPDGGGAK